MSLKDKIDVRLVLRAVARILEKGAQTELGAIYRGVTVVSDFDGYNITVSSRDASITVMFHNTFNAQYRSAVQMTQLYDELKLIARESPP